MANPPARPAAEAADALSFTGRCWQFGDNVPTDEIVPTRYVFSSMDEIGQHMLEGLKPEFPGQVRPGDILAAGHHFGQSSGRAVAPKAIMAAGIACVVAESFARTFLRNCYEIGLPILECPGAGHLAADGEVVRVDLVTGQVTNQASGLTGYGAPTDEFLLSMLRAGGLIPLVRATGRDLGLR